MQKLILPMLFGSNSDRDKIAAGIAKATGEIPTLEITADWLSADNTNSDLMDYLARYRSTPPFAGHAGGKPYVGGAGLSNLLSGVEKTVATIRDLVIAVPVDDSEWDGLPALLSSAEKSPLNPVLAVGINNTYAAANIAVRYMQNTYPLVKFIANQREMASVESALKGFSIPSTYALDTTIEEDDLVLHVFDTAPVQALSIPDVDAILKRGHGIQIGVKQKGGSRDPERYLHILDDTSVTGIVSAGGYQNAAIMAAIIMRHGQALDALERAKAKKRDDLLHAPGLYSVSGRVYEMMAGKMNEVSVDFKKSSRP